MNCTILSVLYWLWPIYSSRFAGAAVEIRGINRKVSGFFTSYGAQNILFAMSPFSYNLFSIKYTMFALKRS